MLEKANTDSPPEEIKANRYSPSGGVKTNRSSPFPSKRRMETPKKANGSGQKGEPPFVHDPFISLEIPSTREPAIAKALGSLAGKLAARIGADHAASWFGGAVIIDAVGDTVTMQLPTKFIRSRVQADYEPVVRQCCSELIPGIRAVRFTVAAEAAA